MSQLQLENLVLKPKWVRCGDLLTRGSTGQSVPHGRCSYCPPGNSPRYVLGAACHESKTGLPGGEHGGQRLAVLHLASSQQQRELIVAVCLLCGAARDHQRLHCTSAALPFPRQLPHRTTSYGANQEKAVAEARQGLVELSAFSFVPVLEGLMRMIESLQEVRTGPSTVAHMYTGHLHGHVAPSS